MISNFFNKENTLFKVCRQSNQEGGKTRWDRIYLHVYFFRKKNRFLKNLGFSKVHVQHHHDFHVLT